MQTLNIMVEDRTLAWLERIAKDRGRGETALQLAENAVEEAALDDAKRRGYLTKPGATTIDIPQDWPPKLDMSEGQGRAFASRFHPVSVSKDGEPVKDVVSYDVTKGEVFANARDQAGNLKIIGSGDRRAIDRIRLTGHFIFRSERQG